MSADLTLTSFWSHAIAAALFVTLILWRLRIGVRQPAQLLMLAGFALTACWAWLSAIAITAILAWQAARQIGFATRVVPFLIVLVGLSLLAGVRLARHPAPGGGKAIEIASGVWTLLMYLSLGAIPALLTARGGV